MNDLPDWLKVLYPFDGHAWQSSEGRLHYVDEGDGHPVVMLHGNPTWSFFYRDLILALRPDCRCLALDHLGCGLSDKPQNAEYTLAGHIRRTVEWLEQLKLDQFHLVVHDWGGAIGFGVARELADRVSGISILNTAAFRFPTIPMRIGVCRVPLMGTLAVRGGNAFVKGATRMTTVNPLSEAVRDGYLFPYQTWADRVAIDAFVKDIPLSKSHRSWKTLLSIEESLSMWATRPVQILWGMRDWCFHEPILREWTQWLPDAEIHRFDEAGHFLLEDAGEQIFPLIKRALQSAGAH